MGVLKYILEEIKKSDLLSTIVAVILLLTVILMFREGIMNFGYFIDKKRKMKNIDSRISKGIEGKRGTYASDSYEMKKFLMKAIIFLTIAGISGVYILLNLGMVLSYLGF